MDVLEKTLGLDGFEHSRLSRQSDARPAPMTAPPQVLPLLLVRTILDHGATVMVGLRSRGRDVQRAPRRWSKSGKTVTVFFLGSDLPG